MHCGYWARHIRRQDDDLGDGDRPRGLFTPRISVILCAEFSDSRIEIEVSIETPPEVSEVVTRHDISQGIQLGFRKIVPVTSACAKTPIELDFIFVYPIP